MAKQQYDAELKMEAIRRLERTGELYLWIPGHRPLAYFL
ncbi:hypothetical protein SATMO3_00930 [Sporomusa aerivorans]